MPIRILTHPHPLLFGLRLPSFNFFRSVPFINFISRTIKYPLVTWEKDFNYISGYNNGLSCLHNDQLPYRNFFLLVFLFWKISIRLENVCISVSLGSKWPLHFFILPFIISISYFIRLNKLVRTYNLGYMEGVRGGNNSFFIFIRYPDNVRRNKQGRKLNVFITTEFFLHSKYFNFIMSSRIWEDREIKFDVVNM